MRNLSMKKFGTPIGGGAGERQRERRVVERRRAVERAAGLLRARLLLGLALELGDELLAVEVAGLERLVLRGRARGRARGLVLAEPGWSRLGAPGGLVAVGRRRRRGSASARRGRRGRVGTGTAGRRAFGVGVAIGPWSMICAIAPEMPGTWIWLAGVPGATSTVRVMRSPVTSTTVDGVQLRRRWERDDAEADRGHDHRNDPVPSVSFVEFASPRAFVRICSAFRAAPGQAGHATERLRAFAIRERLTARYLAPNARIW